MKRASIFGSFARGESTAKSDLDLIIEYKSKNKSLFDLIELKFDLEETLNRKVDVAPIEQFIGGVLHNPPKYRHTLYSSVNDINDLTIRTIEIEENAAKPHKKFIVTIVKSFISLILLSIKSLCGGYATHPFIGDCVSVLSLSK